MGDQEPLEDDFADLADVETLWIRSLLHYMSTDPMATTEADALTMAEYSTLLLHKDDPAVVIGLLTQLTGSILRMIENESEFAVTTYLNAFLLAADIDTIGPQEH